MDAVFASLAASGFLWKQIYAPCLKKGMEGIGDSPPFLLAFFKNSGYC